MALAELLSQIMGPAMATQGMGSLYGLPPAMNLPQLPSPVQQFGALPQEQQEQARRQQLLTLAQLLGSVDAGYLGGAIGSASAQNPLIEQQAMQQFNQQRMDRYGVERQRALEENAIATQAQQRQQMQEVIQGAMGFAGQLVNQFPELGQDVRSRILANAGNPQALMESLAELKSFAENQQQVASQRQQAEQSLSGMGLDSALLQMPADVRQQILASELRPGPQPQMFQYGPHVRSARPGESFSFPERPGGEQELHYDPMRGVLVNTRTGEVQRLDVPPRETGDAWIQTMLQQAMGGEAPPSGPTGLPQPQSQTPQPQQVEQVFQAIRQTAGDMGVTLSERDQRLIRRDLEAAVQQGEDPQVAMRRIMNQILEGG